LPVQDRNRTVFPLTGGVDTAVMRAVPVAQRPAMQAMRDEPDVRRKIAMYAAGLAQRQARSARVQILIRDGRHVDDSLAPVWAKLTDEGLAGMTMPGRHPLDMPTQMPLPNLRRNLVQTFCTSSRRPLRDRSRRRHGAPPPLRCAPRSGGANAGRAGATCEPPGGRH
jgi:hypothetical protein